MEATQGSLYALVKWLIDAVFSSHVTLIAAPMVTVIMLLRFIDWSRRSAKGERAEYLSEDYRTLQEGNELKRRGGGGPARRSSYRRR